MGPLSFHDTDPGYLYLGGLHCRDSCVLLAPLSPHPHRRHDTWPYLQTSLAISVQGGGRVFLQRVKVVLLSWKSFLGPPTSGRQLFIIFS